MTEKISKSSAVIPSEQCDGRKRTNFFLCPFQAIPEGLVHLESLLRADKFRKSLGETSRGYPNPSSFEVSAGMSLKDAFVALLGPSIHPASLKRAKEVEYVRNAAQTILPFLIPPRFQNSK